jgi:hypothetical protein
MGLFLFDKEYVLDIPVLLQVICMDNFFTGTKENVAHLLHKDNFELMRHDVVNPILLEVDEIYHLACPASPVHYKCVSCLSVE